MARGIQVAKPYRRVLIRCTLAICLTIAILCFSKWPPATNARPLEKRAPGYVRPSAEGPQAARTPPHAESTSQHRLADSTPRESEKSTGHRSQDAVGKEDWTAAVRKMQKLMPDDYEKDVLLSPLTKMGESLLRDLAHRTTAFKAVFDGWEALNFALGEDTVSWVNVIPRLRASGLSSEETARAIQGYDTVRGFVNQFANRLFPWTMLSHPDHTSLHASFYGGGQGLVFTAGNDQAKLLLSVIPSIRSLGCDLPIEVFYLGDEDLTEEWRQELEQFPGVTTRDLTVMINDKGWQLKGWAAKPFAILMSSFREAIFIDADAFFFADPGVLFKDEQYLATGALFFKDRNLSPENKRSWIKSILPAPISANVKHNRLWTGESGHMQDSGVVVVDKWRHFVPLLLTTRLNGPDRDGDAAIGKKGVYEMVFGDKETFWLSWEMVGDSDYAFHDSVAGSMGKIAKTHPAEKDENNADAEEIPGKAAEGPMVCSPQLLHFDAAGTPLWFNGWISASKDNRTDWQTFDAYVREPPEAGRKREENAWTIHPGNVICLETQKSSKFTENEMAVLGNILRLGKGTEAYFDEH